VIIVTDARLIDEITSLKKNFNCITIRINNKRKSPLTISQQEHITEVDLDNYDKFDYILENDEVLFNNLKQILEVK